MIDSPGNRARGRISSQELLEKIDELTKEFRALNTKLAETEERLATVSTRADEDPYIAVLSKNAFLREAVRMCRIGSRHDIPLSFVYVNIDAFREVNASFGRRGGDAVLAEVAHQLKTLVRNSDIVGRLGADEFGALMFHSQLENAEAKAATLTEFFAANRVRYLNETIGIAITTGVQKLDTGMWIDELINTAVITALNKRRALTNSAPEIKEG